jgi:hypothetical protein
MLDERELATRPIVQDSVQHNARVSHPLPLPKPTAPLRPYIRLSRADMHLATDGLEHSGTHSLALRCRRWNAGLGVISWFHLLHHRHGRRLCAHLHA